MVIQISSNFLIGEFAGNHHITLQVPDKIKTKGEKIPNLRVLHLGQQEGGRNALSFNSKMKNSCFLSGVPFPKSLSFIHTTFLSGVGEEK